MKITKANRGDLVLTLGELVYAAKKHKAVIVPNSRAFGGRPHPASFVLHQQGATIARLLNMRMYIYIPTKPKEEPGE